MSQSCLKQKKTSFLLSFFISIFLLATAPLSATAQDTESINALRQMGKAFADIAEKASASVVTIRAEKIETQQYYTMPDFPFGTDPFDDEFFDRFFRRRGRGQQQRRSVRRPVQGSGFIISAEGYILTNNHIVSDAEDVYVKLGEDEEIKAEVIGTDPPTDLAVIKIDKENLPFLELADSDKLEVGEWVLAIGNPFGLSHTVTAGIVSAKGRRGFRFSEESPEYQDFIQTDAAINPGNSGGPLINLDCKVVGINSAIIGPSGNIGIGFAIPINMAKDIYEQLITEGKVVRGSLGVWSQELRPEMAELLGLSRDTKGAIITEVIEGTPAEDAGLRTGDIIVKLDDKPLESSSELATRIAATKPGTEVKIEVIREGKPKTVYAKLEEKKTNGQETDEEETDTLKQLGFTVQNLTEQMAERLGFEDLEGVVVTEVEPGSIAQRRGLRAGALIMQVNQKKITSTKEFNEEVEKAKEGTNILLLIKDSDGTRFVLLPISEE